MAPKPHTKASKTSRAVDDFLAQSTIPAGQQQMLENQKLKKEQLAELTEKYLTLSAPTSLQLNFDALNKSRVIINIFAGVSSGVFGNAAFSGLLWWLLTNLIGSVLIYLRLVMMGFESNGESKYFKNAFSASTTGMFGNIMTYLLFWIMFYNITHVV